MATSLRLMMLCRGDLTTKGSELAFGFQCSRAASAAGSKTARAGKHALPPLTLRPTSLLANAVEHHWHDCDSFDPIPLICKTRDLGESEGLLFCGVGMKVSIDGCTDFSNDPKDGSGQRCAVWWLTPFRDDRTKRVTFWTFFPQAKHRYSRRLTTLSYKS